MARRTWVFCFSGLCLIFLSAWAAELTSWVINKDELRTYYGLTPGYDRVTGIDQVRIAVIDNGFSGFGKFKYLPDTAKQITYANFDAAKDVGLDETEPHGRIMAQTTWAMTGGLEKEAPQFLLLNGRGTENTRRAFEWVGNAENKVDVVLMSMNFESTGNFKGDGYVNKWVTDAAKARPEMIIIVAGGNYAGKVFTGPIRVGPVEAGEPARRTLTFGEGRDAKDYLEFQSRVSDDPDRGFSPLSFTVSWNQFTDDATLGTDKDLDVFLYDEHNTLLTTKGGDRAQALRSPAAGGIEAREKIVYSEALVRDKKYRIRLKTKGAATWDAAHDYVRVTMDSGARQPIVERAANKVLDAVNFTSANNTHEIMAPADNAYVITVGELGPFSARGPTLDGRAKPDVLMPQSEIRLSDNTPVKETSTAAAIFAGIVASMKAKEPRLTREHVLRSMVFTMEHAKAYLPRAVGVLTEAIAPEDVTPLLDQTGRLTLVVPQFPRALQPRFPGFNFVREGERLRDFEFYLVQETVFNPPGTVVRGYPRYTVENRGRAEAYPWERLNHDPKAFAMVITAEAQRVRDRQLGGIDPRKLWRTPGPNHLSGIVRPR